MTSVEIILHHEEYINGNKFTYNTNGQNIEVIRFENKPYGYVYHNHKPTQIGTYSINSIKIHSNRENLDFDKHFPVKDVSGFFVYYQLNEKEPLLICIQTMDSKQYITYRYFCPRGRNRLSWMSVPDLVLDPKRSASQQEIKSRLDQQITLMEGIVIKIDKNYSYEQGNIYIELSHETLNGYEVYTHEVESKEPFHVSQITYENKPLEIKDLSNYQIIAVHVLNDKKVKPYKPISVCVVKYEKNNKPNIYEWYFRDSLNSTKWTKEEKFAEDFDIDSIKTYLNKLYDKVYELDINIDKTHFYYSNFTQFNTNGINGTIYFMPNKKSKFKEYIYSMGARRHFKIKSLTIHDQKQVDHPTEVYSRFYIFCHDKNDKEIPLFICVQKFHRKYEWYRLEHFASYKWVRCEELKHCNPEEHVDETDLDKAYSRLFWVDIDIDQSKGSKVEHYNKKSRFIANNTINRDGFKGVETVNYNNYPLYVRILEKGKPIETINETEKLNSVCVFYDDDNEPKFIAFERANYFYKFFWYSKDDLSDTWKLYKKLETKNTRDYNYNLKDHRTKVLIKMEEEEEEQSNTITAQALGTTVGTAACCGLGYFIYTNVSSLSNMVSSLFS